MRRLIAAVLMLIATTPQAVAEYDWKQGDALSLTKLFTVGCTHAGLYRQWDYLAKAGYAEAADIFERVYCQRIGFVPTVPLYVDLPDDLSGSGERNPGVCVMQSNWRRCLWVGREYFRPYGPPQ